mgnify:CR=1 FL=1
MHGREAIQKNARDKTSLKNGTLRKLIERELV